ncbi:hypothetical protein SBV1_810017 [Verrucomicrobia bacterium]|nr:hypothetical protein SBV1_810017 [Verrucomicrobiota bacterium]
MRVNPKIEPTGVAGSTGPKAVAAPRLGRDQATLSAADALNAALDQTPAVRADKLAQAQNKVADDSYPPSQVVRQVASLLARNLRGQKPGDDAP